jgi:hypothetical protein
MGVHRTVENRLQNASLPPTMRTGISVRPPLQYRVNVRLLRSNGSQLVTVEWTGSATLGRRCSKTCEGEGVRRRPRCPTR